MSRFGGVSHLPGVGGFLRRQLALGKGRKEWKLVFWKEGRKLSNSQGQKAVGTRVSFEVGKPVPPTLKQSWLVGTHTGVDGNSQGLGAGDARKAGRMWGPQGLWQWDEHVRAASDFLASKTPGFWDDPWERKWPQQVMLNLVQTMAWGALRARFDGIWGE